MPDKRAAPAQFSQGAALHQQGKLADAERIYREVLQRQPNHFDALHLLGVIALQTQRTEQGVELIRTAIELNPNVAAPHSDLSVALTELKRPTEALASCNRAIALKPDFAEAHNNRGNALLELKRQTEALASYDRAIALKPDYAKAFNNRGNALTELKRPTEALVSYDRAITLNADFAEAYNNRGNALTELKRSAEAVASYDRAIAVKSDYAEAHYNRGNALTGLKRPAEAVASYGRAIALRPDYAEAYWNQSLCFLLMGNFEQGLLQYEWRKKLDEPIAVRSYPQPLWLGKENIARKALFIYWEQGFGDTIQFCRYAKLVEMRGAKVIMSVQEPLRELLKQISPTIQIMKSNEDPTDFDYHCPLLSLPLAFATTLETIPAERQYIRSHEELRASWAARLPPRTKPRIGVVWSGAAGRNNDYNRSMELQELLPIFSPVADWTCLQKEIREGDSAVLRQAGCIAFFGDDLEDFSDTAALMDLMDLVITIDTSVAHLAGAMGKPVWILLAYNHDWRWLLERNDSPWYPSARLFSQQQLGNWAAVIDQVRNELPGAIENMPLTRRGMDLTKCQV
jgi:tetratricopeptide (TPR) repeat protein